MDGFSDSFGASPVPDAEAEAETETDPAAPKQSVLTDTDNVGHQAEEGLGKNVDQDRVSADRGHRNATGSGIKRRCDLTKTRVNAKRRKVDESSQTKIDIISHLKLPESNRRFGVVREGRNLYTSKWSSLLSAVVYSPRYSDPTNSHHRAELVIPPNSIPPLTNSLLLKYDPMKILNRPSLLSTLRTNVPDSESASVPSLARANLLTGRSERPARKLMHRSPDPTSQSSNFTNTSVLNGSLQPKSAQPPVDCHSGTTLPKIYPLPWGYRRTTTQRHINNTPSKPQKSSQSGVNDPPTAQVRHNSLPYFKPKVDPVGVSLIDKETKFCSYDDREPVEISECTARLACISFARKAICEAQQKQRKDANQSTSPVAAASSGAAGTKGKNLSHPSASTSASHDDQPGTREAESRTESLSVPLLIGEVNRTKNPGLKFKVQENPYVDNAIELLREKRDVERKIEVLEDDGIIHRMLQLPQLKKVSKVPLVVQNTPLTATNAKDIIQARLAILLAHGGFTHVNLQPLDILSDVLENFYQKMTHRLKQVTEMEMAGCDHGFPDPMERVLMESGSGGVRGLEKYYKTRVIDYRKRLEDQCIQLRNQYTSKIRAKVGRVGSTQRSNSSKTWSQQLSPGNSGLLLTDILRGLERPTASSYLSAIGSNRKGPPTQQGMLYQPPKSGDPVPLSLSEVQQPQEYLRTSAHQPISTYVPNSTVNLTQGKNAYHQNNSTSPSSTVLNRSVKVAKSVTLMQGGGNSNPSLNMSNNMVSINLNNNLELGGYVGVPSPKSNVTSAVQNVARPVVSTINSKAKLKEALSQRNLLRLNFEQAPSNCDSTVILSSSSTPPSISASSSASKSSNNPARTISQTKQLKL